MFFFFFFQAEDGIRDHCVTGVQTCALPISLNSGRGGGIRTPIPGFGDRSPNRWTTPLRTKPALVLPPKHTSVTSLPCAECACGTNCKTSWSPGGRSVSFCFLSLCSCDFCNRHT